MTPKLTVEQVAQLCHNLHRDLCWLLADYSVPPFDLAPEWMVESTIQGVCYRLENPAATPEQMHDNWMQLKIAEGWMYGPNKDSDQRLHPCLVPYDQLGPEQKLKDYLIGAVVESVRAVGMAPTVEEGAQ